MTTTDAAIIGAASLVGKHPGETSLMLHARVARAALEDAGTDPGEVDGLLTLGSFSDTYLMHAVAVAEYLGLHDLAYADTVAVGGASAVAAVIRAGLVVDAGIARRVLVVSADDQLSGMTPDRAIAAMFENRHPQYEAPYGPITAACYALAARRYLHHHDLDEELLAHATVQSRRWAGANPDALVRKAHTVEDVWASRPIADPLRIFHCAPIADGGGAVVVGRPGPGRPSVALRGRGERHTNAHLVHNADLVGSPARAAARTAYADAGVAPADVQLALVYDAFASSVGTSLEDLDLAPPGRAFHAFRDGEFGPDGRLPVNPHGGLLSAGHPGYPGGMLHVVEAAHQLTGRGSTPTGAELALVHGSGGILTTHAVALLEARA